MSRVILPYRLRDGQKAYASRVMADLDALAGTLNSVRVSGLAEGDLGDALEQLKALADQAVKAHETGNAAKIRFSDGQTMQEKLEGGQLNGANAVVNTSDGMYYFYVDQEDGHLYVVCRSENQGAAFSIDQRGHLIYTLEDPAEAEATLQAYDLGSVRGPAGPSGDMAAAVYDPNGQRQDVFAYVDRAVENRAGTRAGLVWANAADWDGATYQNPVTVSGLTAGDHFLVGLSAQATAEQRQAWRDGKIYLAEQRSGGFLLGADGSVPEVNLPLEVLILP